MKKIALLLIILFSLAATAQSNSFLVSSNKLVWENVFISSEANIPTIISRHTRLKITSSTTTIFKGTGSDLQNTCPDTPAFMKDAFSFDFEIEVSDGKYRVTITNLVFKKLKAKTAKAKTAENYFIKEGKLITEKQVQAALACLDTYFNKIFSATTVYKNRS